MTEAYPDITEAEIERLEAECEAAGVLDFYFEMVKAGEYPRGAAMCALMQPPGTKNTDRAFCEGQHRKMERMSPANRRKMQELARKAGISTDGKFYVGGLGKYTDPKAWVSNQDDVITACKLTKSAATGVLNCDYMEHDKEPKRLPLAPDIVNRFVRKRLRADPSLAEKVKRNPKKLREVQESIVSRHGARLGRT